MYNYDYDYQVYNLVMDVTTSTNNGPLQAIKVQLTSINGLHLATCVRYL